MSLKKDIFKTVGDYLMLNAKDLENLPNLQWFDKQMGQFDSPELTYGLPLPCVLFEFGQFTWTTIGQNQQKGEGSIRVYIYFENYANSFTGSLNQDLALQFFEFTEAIHQLLQGFSIKDKMSALERIGDAEDVAQDMIITSVMDYSTTIYDNSTGQYRNFADVDPTVNVDKKATTSRPLPDIDTTFITT